MSNKINEIRKLLGNEYHLYEGVSINGIKWILYRRYLDSKVYFSNDNEAIMSSETNTIDDLYKFAKDHHKVDEIEVELTIDSIIAFLLMILQIINFAVLKNDYIKGLILGSDLMIIISCLTKLIIVEKNNKKELNEIREQFKRNIERMEK